MTELIAPEFTKGINMSGVNGRIRFNEIVVIDAIYGKLKFYQLKILFILFELGLILCLFSECIQKNNTVTKHEVEYSGWGYKAREKQ